MCVSDADMSESEKLHAHNQPVIFSDDRLKKHHIKTEIYVETPEGQTCDIGRRYWEPKKQIHLRLLLDEMSLQQCRCFKLSRSLKPQNLHCSYKFLNWTKGMVTDVIWSAREPSRVLFGADVEPFQNALKTHLHCRPSYLKSLNLRESDLRHVLKIQSDCEVSRLYRTKHLQTVIEA